MKLGLFSLRISGKLRQLFFASHCYLLSAVRADPDIKRSSPVSVTGNSPVLDIFKPVSETSLSHGGGNPVYLLIVLNKTVPDLGHFDKPGLSCIVKKGCIASPAMGIVMLKLRCAKENASFIKILKNLGIRIDGTFFYFSLCGLAAHSGKFSGFRL